MFESLGLFKEVQCPESGRCPLLNCIFAHDRQQTDTVTKAPKPAHPVEEPLPKRRRIDRESSDHSRNEDRLKSQRNLGASPAPQPAASPDVPNLRSMKRSVSPPKAAPSSTKKTTVSTSETDNNSKSEKLAGNTAPIREIKKESLNPRLLLKPPASHSIRLSILKGLHDAIVKLNDQIKKDQNESKSTPVLSPHEIISMALDEEEKVARDSPAVYSNLVKMRIIKLRKMSTAEWKEVVINFLRLKAPAAPTSPAGENHKPEITTELKPEEEIAMLSKLMAPVEDLKKLDYVIEAPTPEEMASAERGTEASQGWERCERCNGRFQVFPGRREDGALTSGGPCVYHYARPMRPAKQKTDRVVGHKESTYPCCNEPISASSGCTKAESHVFKVSDIKRLAAILQFEATPSQPDKGDFPPVCFDCEMGYTTLGLELIRLTAVTWPDLKPLIDVLVRPMGEVLDLNTRFSGVNSEQFANALPYNSASDSSSANTTTALQIVESPAAARALLFEHIQPETPLIGHALENDLKACRILHPTIVDTTQLYPHPGGLPMRFGLRMLSKRFLNREIQTGGGTRGHDSMEDAQATGDLVRVKAREKWKVLKRLGWEIRHGKLVDPSAGKPSPARRTYQPISLGAGAGAKRKL